MTTNPSLDRRWIQIHGLPVDRLTGAVRAEIDQANSVKVADGAQRCVLFDADNRPICAIDFMPEAFQRIDQARDKPTLPQPDPKAGDTVIRPITATEAASIGVARDYHDPDREVPPLDLPDYDPYADDCSRARLNRQALWISAITILIVAALAIAAIFGAFDSTPVAIGGR